jgi:sulfate adenylyltransferase (ADP) / ATP adenylyltransferase
MSKVLGLAEPLSALVETRYKAALASEALTYTEPEKALIQTTTGVPFQLRFCPHLNQKPTPLKAESVSSSSSTRDQEKTPKEASSKKPFDPFDNPNGPLLITHIPQKDPTHVLVLNKFPIIKGHFILATKAFAEQTDTLQLGDLWMTYLLLKTWEESDGKKLFAFFNCGTESGASQPHRHLQFLPVESVAEGFEGGVQLLVDRLAQKDGGRDVPFASFAETLSEGITSEGLYALYRKFLDQATRAWTRDPLRKMRTHEEGGTHLGFCYNLGMTTTSFALCPRKTEGVQLHDATRSEDLGIVGFNGALMAGGLMVKRREQWEYLRKQKGALDEILEGIGIPREKDGNGGGGKVANI